MLTRTIRIQVGAFILIALLGVSYVAIHYVGLQRLIGESGYTVTLDLPSSGGIFTNAEVDYRGVPIGRVGDMTLTAKGISVKLDITSGRHIPASTKAFVADRSVIGEQYVDLRPSTTDGPYLHDGSRLSAGTSALPAPIQDLLLSSDQFVHSVPIASLQTVVNELYSATAGSSQDLQLLLDKSKSFFTAADANLPQTLDLIDSSKTVLATQVNESGAITTFSANLALIGQQLQSSDGDITKILADGVPAAQQVTGLIDDIHGSLASLLSGLLSTSTVFLAHKGALQELLVQLPVVVGIGGKVVTPNGINVGLVPTFFDPLPCTSGYSGTTHHTGLGAASSTLNSSAGCTASSSSGIDVRGSQHAPHN